MHAQYLIFNKSSNWKTIEKIDEILPEFDRVSASAFFPEAIDARYVLALMISSQHEDAFWVFYLICEEETESFN